MMKVGRMLQFDPLKGSRSVTLTLKDPWRVAEVTSPLSALNPPRRGRSRDSLKRMRNGEAAGKLEGVRGDKTQNGETKSL